MVYENQNTDIQIKTEQIIVAAQTIFGRYGLRKTTMKEIATELGISKALLYYYFPDKEHIYKAVVEKEHQQFFTDLSARLSKIERAENMLLEFVNVRLQHFKSLLNLSRFRMEDWSGMKPLMENVWQAFRDREVEFIKDILSKGKAENSFHFESAHEMSEIFLDLLRGLLHVTVKRNQIFYLEQAEFDILLKKAGIFTNMFIRGLKYN